MQYALGVGAIVSLYQKLKCLGGIFQNATTIGYNLGLIML